MSSLLAGSKLNSYPRTRNKVVGVLCMAALENEDAAESGASGGGGTLCEMTHTHYDDLHP